MDLASTLGGIILRVLGERLNGIQEVSGSIPLISTKTNKSRFTALIGFTVPFINTKRGVLCSQEMFLLRVNNDLTQTAVPKPDISIIEFAVVVQKIL